jgi:hypothetical protein
MASDQERRRRHADLSDDLARLVYELLDAHYDTVRLVEDAAEDERWHAHLAYLRDLQRVARELLATATAEDGAPGSGRLRRALGRARRVGRGHQTADRSARPRALHK